MPTCWMWSKVGQAICLPALFRARSHLSLQAAGFKSCVIFFSPGAADEMAPIALETQDKAKAEPEKVSVRAHFEGRECYEAMMFC